MTYLIDHLVVAARTLQEGVAWAEDRLGVALQPGGRHPQFGTHNALVSLGGCYLEVIATDPDAPAPARPRWFGLDSAEMQARLQSGPALIHWVVGAPGGHDAPDAAQSGSEAEGAWPVLTLERGDYRWDLTVPDGGELPGGGALPSRITWHTASPLAQLPDQGLRLLRLELLSPQAPTLQHWAGDWSGVNVTVQPAHEVRLLADIQTPAGVVHL